MPQEGWHIYGQKVGTACPGIWGLCLESSSPSLQDTLAMFPHVHDACAAITVDPRLFLALSFRSSGSGERLLHRGSLPPPPPLHLCVLGKVLVKTDQR